MCVQMRKIQLSTSSQKCLTLQTIEETEFYDWLYAISPLLVGQLRSATYVESYVIVLSSLFFAVQFYFEKLPVTSCQNMRCLDWSYLVELFTSLYRVVKKLSKLWTTLHTLFQAYDKNPSQQSIGLYLSYIRSTVWSLSMPSSDYRKALNDRIPSHTRTRTVVRECCNGDEASQ